MVYPSNTMIKVVAHFTFSYDKLRNILKKKGLTVGGVFGTNGSPLKSAEYGLAGEDGAAAKSKHRTPRKKTGDAKDSKKRKLDDIEREYEDDDEY